MDYTLRANLTKICFYICPTCHNVIHSFGPVELQCCGIPLKQAVPKEAEGEHLARMSRSEGDIYLSFHHPMTKEHALSFVAFIKPERMELVKLYPESSAEARLSYRGTGHLYAYCNVHGMFHQKVGVLK